MFVGPNCGRHCDNVRPAEAQPAPAPAGAHPPSPATRLGSRLCYLTCLCAARPAHHLDALLPQATRAIAEGERLCTIPKAACLSIRTTQLADVIEAEELGGGLGLVLAVLHEMSLGQDSKW